MYDDSSSMTTLVVLTILQILSKPNFFDYLHAAKYKTHWRGKAGEKTMTRVKVPL